MKQKYIELALDCFDTIQSGTELAISENEKKIIIAAISESIELSIKPIESKKFLLRAVGEFHEWCTTHLDELTSKGNDVKNCVVAWEKSLINKSK